MKTFVATHSFRGNPAQSQLTFPAGAQIQASASFGEWIWGTYQGSSGWLPESYVVQVIGDGQLNSSVLESRYVPEESGGFDGEPMGGKSPRPATSESPNPSDNPFQSPSSTSASTTYTNEKKSGIASQAKQLFGKVKRLRRKTKTAPSHEEPKTDYHITVNYTSPSEELAQQRRRRFR